MSEVGSPKSFCYYCRRTLPTGWSGLVCARCKTYFDQIQVVKDLSDHLGIKVAEGGATPSSYSSFNIDDNGYVDSLTLRGVVRVDLPILDRFIRLQTLDLSTNGLDCLTTVPHLPHLTQFLLNQNRLTDLPSEISQRMPFLQVLELRENHFSSIPPVVSELSHLEHLYLDRNSLRIVPDFLNTLTTLKTLSLPSNLIEYVPEGLESLKNLEGLYLANNPLDSLPSSLQFLENLRYLSLTHTGVASNDPTLLELRRRGVRVY